jgi:hypothetical protein
MSEEEKILALMDQYFEKTDSKQLNEDLKFITNLGADGVTFEEYLDILNDVTSVELAENGICDDIAYVDLFRSLMSKISMDDCNKIQTVSPFHFESLHSGFRASENNYAMAA